MASDRRQHGKATWTQDKGYDFESGKVIAAAPRSFHPGDTTHDSSDLGGIHSHVCLVLTNMNTIVRRSVVTTMVSISTSSSTPQSLGLSVEKK